MMKSPNKVKFSTNIFNLDNHDSWETIGVTKPGQVFQNWRHIFVDSSDLVKDLVGEKEEVGRWRTQPSEIFIRDEQGSAQLSFFLLLPLVLISIKKD